METNQSTGPEYDPDQALADAQGTRERMAERAAAPSYYYPALATAVGLLIAAEAVGGAVATLGVIICAVTSVVLLSRYRSATGLWAVYGSSTRQAVAVWASFALSLFVLLGVAVWAQVHDHPWWGIPLGLAAFAVTLVVGRRVEAGLREEIRAGRITPRSAS